MTMDKSLRMRGSMARTRNVLTLRRADWPPAGRRPLARRR